MRDRRFGLEPGYPDFSFRADGLAADHKAPLSHKPPYASDWKYIPSIDAPISRAEAALFWADEPLTQRKLARLAEPEDAGEARRTVDRLNELYHSQGSAFQVEEIAGGYQLLTRPELRPWLDKFFRPPREAQLTGPTLETLAIVAYRQPITRADIEAIRGVQVGDILKHLMDRGFVKAVGKEESLGRPFLYGTTKSFLQTFGLRNLNELPMVELLAKPKAAQENAPAATLDPVESEDTEEDDA